MIRRILLASLVSVAPLSGGIAQAQESGAELGSPTIAGEPGAAIDSVALDPPAADPGPFRFPHVAARPLTLPEGMARVDQLIFYRFFDIPVPWRGVPTGLSVGLLDDLELGVTWGVLDDPSVRVLGRVVADPVIDLGLSAQLTVPAITTGDTLARVGAPIAIRPAAWLRFDTGLFVELLFTAQVSPLAQVPLTITFAPHELFFFGAMGSAGWLDGSRWIGDGGGFVGWSGRNEHGVIADGRIAVQYFVPTDDVVVSLGLRFFPRFWR